MSVKSITLYALSYKLLFLTEKIEPLQQVDAQEFYTNEEIRLTALVEEEKNVALSKPLGVAFVTLGIFHLYKYCFLFFPKSIRKLIICN